MRRNCPAASQIEVVDSGGKRAESQLLSMDPETHRARFLLLASTPSLGYQTYFVRATGKATPLHSMLRATADTLENEFVRVKIDRPTGCMTSLFDKRSDTESLAPSETDSGGPKTSVCGNLLQAFVDKPKQWDAWNIDADFEKQHWDLDKADEVKLVESGPLRAVIRVKNQFQNSTFVRDITIYGGVPRVDVKMQTEWHEKHILLKVAFPVSAHSNEATYEIPFGSVERGGGWKDALTIREGYELNYRLIALVFGEHQGTLPAEHSFVEVKSDNVIVSAMKKAEDGQALILRFYEWAGKPGSITFHLPPGAQSARETNLMEKPIADLPLTNSELTVPTKPYEIKTVEIKFAGVPAIGESAQQ